jgi:hypothetical protein
MCLSVMLYAHCLLCSSCNSMFHYSQSPLSPQEHHLAPNGCFVPVILYENEPSSLIAYALSSQEYQHSLDDMLAKRTSTTEHATPRYVSINIYFVIYKCLLLSVFLCSSNFQQLGCGDEMLMLHFPNSCRDNDISLLRDSASQR